MTPSAVSVATTKRRSSWRRLAMAGALLAVGEICVHVPAALWAGNAAAIAASGPGLAAAGIGATLLGTLAIVLLVGAMPEAWRLGASSVVAALGITCWVYASFVATDMLPLNGVDAPMDFRTAIGGWEIVLAAGATACLALGMRRQPRLATAALVVLNAGLWAATVGTVTTVRLDPLPKILSVVNRPSIFRFSTKANVLVVILDTLQSDIAEQVLDQKPALGSHLDGFEFYPDTAGVAPTTYVSLPAIVSGDALPASGSLKTYFQASLTQRTFLNRLAGGGYETTTVNPLAGQCAEASVNCVAEVDLLRSHSRQLIDEVRRLMDLSLFRVAPVAWRPWMYHDGRWRLQPVPAEHQMVLDGNATARLFARNLTADAGPPAAKLLHLFSTHPPFIVDDRCAEPAPLTAPVRIPMQTACAFAAVADLLDAMKAAGVYDNSVILILGDHGTAPVSRGADDTEPERLAGAPNPAFLVKRPGQHGALRKVDAPVQVSDVTATLCAASGACAADSGIPAGLARAPRTRRYHSYTWRHEMWGAADIPDLIEYDIDGPVRARESWRRATPAAEYVLGTPIQPSDAASARYLTAGWADPESWGRWTVGADATVLLRVHGDTSPRASLVARVHALVPSSGQQVVTWFANGHPIGTWTFDTNFTESERRLAIPPDAWLNGQLELRAHISAPTAPAAVGLGGDTRALGFALHGFTIVVE